MDTTLERILSLIPKKEDGSFVHGGKAAFARSIGYDSGEIVSMWIKGSSNSYLKKLHEIAAKYGVSVEWLRGETDERSTAPEPESDELREYLDMLRNRPECRMLLSTVKGATKEEVEANVKLIEALRGFRG
jgi:transcriptional regulator with XRE-family HTH domain